MTELNLKVVLPTLHVKALSIKQVFKFSIVLLLTFAWLVTGWPPLWQNPTFPPKIKDAQAGTYSIVKQVSLFNQVTATRANTSYAVPSFSMPWLYTAGNYDGNIAVYFEAVLSISNASYSARAGLYTTGGSQIASSIVATQATGATRVRSGDIFSSLADGTAYQARISSSSSSGTTTIYAARLIIVQSGTVTKTETIYDLGANDTTTNTSYEDDGLKAYYYYDSDQFNGTVALYFESFISANSGSRTGYAQLADSSSAVASSEVSHTGSTDTSKRSSVISLTDNTIYKVQIKTSAGTGRCRSARVIIVQSGGFTKTESYYPIKMTLNTATSTQENSNGWIYWDDDEWDVSSKSVLHEAWLRPVGGDTAYTDLNDGTNDDDTRSTTTTAITRDISGALTLDDNTNYDGQVRNSDGSSASFYGNLLRIQAVLGEVTVSSTGSQTSSLTIPSTNQTVGGVFTFTSDVSTNITAITITEYGSVDAQNDLDNIKLYYESDTSDPYDCSGFTYAGTEEQYGTTDDTGFSSADGTATFTENVAVSSTSTLCIHTVLDIGSGATGGEDLELRITASTDATVDLGIVVGTFPVDLSGTTSLSGGVAITLSTSGSVAFGTNPLNSTEDTTASGINDVETVSVDSGPADLDVQSEAFSDGSNTWTLATSNGSDQVKWEFSPDGSVWTTFAAPDTLYPLATNISQSSTQNVYFRLTTPTSTSSYSPHSTTITIVASTP